MTDTPTTTWFGEETATFGDRLAGARDHAGLSQAALARQIGVKTSTIAGWEDDEREPRANRLQMLSGLLGVSLTWLLTGRGDGPSEPADIVSDEDGPNGADLALILTDMRGLQTEMVASADRLARLEKRLRRALKEA